MKCPSCKRTIKSNERFCRCGQEVICSEPINPQSINSFSVKSSKTVQTPKLKIIKSNLKSRAITFIIIIALINFFSNISFPIDEINDYSNLDDGKESTYNYGDPNQYNQNLNYTVPLIFEAWNENEDWYQSYNYSGNESKCDFTIISRKNHSNFTDDDQDKYLLDAIYLTEDSEIVRETRLNYANHDWSHVQIERGYATDHVLILIKDDTIYDFEYTIYRDTNGVCSNALKELVESMNFE